MPSQNIFEGDEISRDLHEILALVVVHLSLGPYGVLHPLVYSVVT